jgi:hypothetical protein
MGRLVISKGVGQHRAPAAKKKIVARFPAGGNVESSSAIEIAKHTLLSGGLILAVGTITGFVAGRSGFPTLRCF